MPMYTLGVDTGGTFTDFILRSDAGIATYKIPSTPADPSQAILAGLSHFFGAALPAGLEVVHGTTVGTNAFLERKGARTVLVTTHGFEDVLFIGRQNRSRLYDLALRRPAPVIGPEDCLGVRERLRWDGAVLKPLAASVGRRLRRFCRERQAESVAICLLHSYANPAHEQAVKRMLAGLGLPVTLSAEILPEFREYERLCTTLINAYLAPVVSSYIDRLAGRLAGVPLYIQQSNGGMLPAAGIGDRAVHTLLSGPAGGVHGAFELAEAIGLPRIVTFDMGGTSTDVSLCDGRPSLTRDYRIDEYPVRVPVLDIHTVGAGGGSIARLDAGGLLQVGPESAGADPGPICYGKGSELTVTDANLFLGRLLPDRFLGGAMPLHRQRLEEAMGRLAGRLGLAPAEAALGIVRIVNAGMVKAIRKVSLENGHDPKEFALFSFGGASGLHCCELARELGMRRVVVPARAGILSAQGMVMAEPVVDFGQACFLSGIELTGARLERAFAALEARGRGEAAALWGRGGELAVERFVDLRYQGQSHEISVAFAADFEARFHAAHYQLFGYALEKRPLELVAVRIAIRRRRPPQLLPRSGTRAHGRPPAAGKTPIRFAEGERMVPLYLRRELVAGHGCAGPALVVDDYTTVLVPEGFRLEVDDLLNLIVECDG